MAIPTKSFRNGRSTAVRIPAEFGIKPGEELVLSQDEDGTVRVARAKPFASFFAAVERMRAGGSDPARDPPLQVPRMGPPREVDVASEPPGKYKPAARRRRTK
jgi:virulence-associated protein VagC